MRVIKKVLHGTATMSSAASVQIVAANSSRKGLSIGGHATVGLWLGFGQAAVVGTGHFVPPGATALFDESDGNLWQGAVTGILTSGGNQVVGTAEFV